MKFMIELVTAYVLRNSIETENGLPVMYPFGQTVAKACVIRCISQERAKAIIRQLHFNGTIEFGVGDDKRKIRVNSGFDNRNPEQKAAEFQMRKLRSAILRHGVPRETFFTEWKYSKLWIMPDGRSEHKEEMARWNSKEWTYEF